MDRTAGELPAGRLGELNTAALTYATVGVTTDDRAVGVEQFDQRIGSGAARFEQAAEATMRFQVQLRAGLRVVASAPRAAVGVVLDQYFGIGRLALRAPCRVVTVVDEPRRRGFAYGTLPGHPESGEEAFLVEHLADDSVVFTVRAAAHPATLLARLAKPVSRMVQLFIVRRYLRALVSSPRS